MAARDSKPQKRNNSNLKLIFLDLFLLALITVFLIIFVPKIIPIFQKSKMPPLSMEQTGDGSWLLNWTSVSTGGPYTVTVTSGGQLVYSQQCTERSCVLPSYLPQDQAVTIHVGKEQRNGEEKLLASASCFLHSTDSSLDYVFDYENKALVVTFRGGISDTYCIYLVKPNGTEEEIKRQSYTRTLQAAGASSMEITGVPGEVRLTVEFGESGTHKDYVIPTGDSSYTFIAKAMRLQDDLVIYELVSDMITITENNFRDTVLVLEEPEKIGENNYLLRWNDTGDEAYAVQMRGIGDWENVATVNAGEPCEYETGHLTPGQTLSFRVVPFGRMGAPTPSMEQTVSTSVSALYATIWPTKELAVYADTDRAERIGSVTVGRSYCVLDDYRDGSTRLLKIRSAAGEGWIDGNYCMINLPEYVGDMCQYDITNSYYSIYLAHEYAIPNVSGRVTTGYEHVLLSDGTFLVPLLYPVVDKLIAAAATAREQGYIIRIYDSFRPYVATREIYDETEKVLDVRLPDSKFHRITLDEYLMLRSRDILPSPSSSELPAGTSIVITDPDTGESVVQQYSGGSSNQTYRQIMLGGGYSLGAFLAARGSTHNLGVAMDLTIVSISSGEELPMQTSMHDLSQYSAQSQNISTSNQLKEIMMPAGFGMIRSEWWHFQDDEARSSLSLASVTNGVSIEGWKYDGYGWRYRQIDGSYYVNTTQEIDGESYHFDDKGYTEDY